MCCFFPLLFFLTGAGTISSSSSAELPTPKAVGPGMKPACCCSLLSARFDMTVVRLGLGVMANPNQRQTAQMENKCELRININMTTSATNCYAVRPCLCQNKKPKNLFLISILPLI